MAADKQLDFAEFIKAEREKKRKEQLASEILGRGRKTTGSGAAARKNAPTGPSLASRMGVNKQQRSSSARPNIDAKWKHDLFPGRNQRVDQPGLHRTASNPQFNRNARGGFRNAAPRAPRDPADVTGGGFNIRGMGGFEGYTVVASNFAPGTTATDIEAVMSPIGGDMTCRLVSAQPTVIAEMTFVDKQGAEEVIAMFNNKKADGRQLYVYMKTPQPTVAPRSFRKAAQPPPVAPLARAADDMDLDQNQGPQGAYPDYAKDPRQREIFQDGNYGFPESSAGYWGNRRERY